MLPPPTRGGLALMIQDNPHRTGTDLRENLFTVVFIVVPVYFRGGAVESPGAFQSTKSPKLGDYFRDRLENVHFDQAV